MTLRRPQHDDLDEDVLDAAAGWRIRRDAPQWSAEDQSALDAWLARDARHARAFAQTGLVWDFFDTQAAAPEMMLTRRNALDGAHRATRRLRAGGGTGWKRFSRARGLAVAACVALAVMAAYPLIDGTSVYRTDRGERRTVILADGSAISLDALTEVSVSYSKSARKLRLIGGQARFDVAKDVSRPFSVAVRDQAVIATGTAFNIDMVEPRARVTLIEGHILIVPRRDFLSLGTSLAAGVRGHEAKAPETLVELHAGQQLIAGEKSTPAVVVDADLPKTTAWQGGKIVFNDEPLGEAIARLNRYSRRELVVGDAAAAETRISGTCDLNRVDSFVDAMVDYLHLVATPDQTRLVLTGAQSD